MQCVGGRFSRTASYGAASHFEPLNAKQIERPSPFIIDADLESAGCELVEETSQGFVFLSP